MLNLGRREDADKPMPKPALPAAGAVNVTGTLAATTRPSAPPPATPVAREPALPQEADAATRAGAPEKDAGPATIGPETPGSRLCVGPKIKLKGVEISDCDVLVVEGEVEATVNSKAMQIAQPGTLKGHVSIDVAEIFGEFSGELTARTKLIVHGTGRVSGTIRYGKLIVAEGGVLSGDIQRLDAPAEATIARAAAEPTVARSAAEGRPLLSPQTAR
jgi:cytoskeletal protein CcmA (bactofilin family)